MNADRIVPILGCGKRVAFPRIRSDLYAVPLNKHLKDAYMFWDKVIDEYHLLFLSWDNLQIMTRPSEFCSEGLSYIKCIGTKSGSIYWRGGRYFSCRLAM